MLGFIAQRDLSGTIRTTFANFNITAAHWPSAFSSRFGLAL
jgi:hypothetical protein